MQNSELYRRGIVVPLDDIAEEELRLNCASAAARVDFLTIDDSLFTLLWVNGFFIQINRECNVMLDDYEECVIEYEYLPALLSALRAFDHNTMVLQKCVNEFCNALHILIGNAVSMRRPLFFVL